MLYEAEENGVFRRIIAGSLNKLKPSLGIILFSRKIDRAKCRRNVGKKKRKNLQ